MSRYLVHIQGARHCASDDTSNYLAQWLEAAERYGTAVEKVECRFPEPPIVILWVSAESCFDAIGRVVSTFDALRPVTHIAVTQV